MPQAKSRFLGYLDDHYIVCATTLLSPTPDLLQLFYNKAVSQTIVIAF